MSRWYIVRYDGGVPVTVARCESLELHEEWMGDSYVTVTVKSAVPIDFRIGDSIMYRGEQYSILDDPNIIKKARSGSYQEGFTYDNIKLYPESARMKHIAFNDYVLPDPDAPANKIPYSSLNIFSFFAASVEDLADRIQANLNRVEPTMWYVYTPNKARSRQRGIPESDWRQHYEGEGEDITGKTDVNVTVSGLSCWEALKLAYTSFDVSYYITGRSIIIGGTPVSTEHDFRYGKGLGLHEIERTTDESQDVVTKLYCYGSEKNIPYGYYANIGKRIRFQIKTKTEREYIARNPRLLLWVEVPYQDVKKAFNDQGMFEVELECNGYNATFRGWGDTFTYGSEQEDPTLDHETVYLNFYTHQDDTAGAALYNSVSAGSYVYVTRGMNINKLQSEFVVIPQSYDYDAALSVNRLMLPGFPEQSLFDWVRTNGGTVLDSEKGIVGWKSWSFYASKDKKDPWIMSLRKDIEGIREGTVTFDESSGNEIFPTIEGTGLDVVSWAEQMDDNGYLGDEPKESEKVFMMQPSTILGYKIDWNDTDGEEVTISMKDGACVGREFKMKKAQKNEDTQLWELTLERYFDSSIGRYFPYDANASGARNLYQVMGSGNWQGTKTGDRFVALGIKLPSSYVQLAAEKLLEESLKELKKIDHHRHTYVPKVDEIYMQRQDDFAKSTYEEGDQRISEYGTVSLHDTLRAGMQFDMSDTDLGLDHYKPYIDVLTIKEDGNNGIPTYDVVMREEKELTLQERLQSQIEGGVKEYVNLTDKGTSVYGEYLSKVEEDETEYLIRFLGGIIFDRFVNSEEFIRGNWVPVLDPDTGEPVLDPDTGETMMENDGIGAGLTKDGSVWTLEVDEVIARLLLRARRIVAEQAQIGKVTNQTVFKMGLRALGDILLGNYTEGLDPDEQEGGKLTPDGYADIRNLFARLKAVIGNGLITEETEPGVFVREPSLTVNGDSAFSDWLSSFSFESGFPFGKGWAIKSFEYTNPAGQTETKWSLEIDNVTVRNILRVYEMIISQLRGENDNYIFAAMMEVDHYDPLTGKVWLSTNGGKTYMSFRVGDCIMVQRYQPGNTAASGGDGYITKMYELVISEVGTGGEGDPTDENGDRLDWVKFVNFTTPMLFDKDDSRHEQEDYKGTYYTEEDLEALRAQIRQKHPTWSKEEIEEYLQSLIMLPEKLIEKGDTFCRVDNLYDPERKGVVQINSVGPDAPYMDVRYGTKTDPNNSLKVRVGNLGGIRSELFGGWLQGYGVYDINNYSVGTFVNKQTGERTESRVAISDKEMQINYKETLYDVSDEDNKVTNGFFQDEMEGWDMCHADGSLLSPSEITQQETKECVGLEVGDTPLLINGSILQFSQTVDYAKMSEYDGIKVLHLHNMGVSQYFSLMKENGTHEEDATGGTGTQPDFTKEDFDYWKAEQPTWTDAQILAKIDEWIAINESRIDALSATDDVADKLYCGIRILPLTEGDLTVKFIPTSGSTMTLTRHFGAALEWQMSEWQDHSASGEVWEYDPSDTYGRFIVSYTGECYIRFVALTNDPISDAKAEYESWFNINSRRIDLHAQRTIDGKTNAADLWIQHNAIVSRVTTDEVNEKNRFEKLTGITIKSDGTFDFPDDWVSVDGKYDYSSWRIQTAGRIDDIVSKWDENDNLIGYSQHTQTADFIRNVIASTASYGNWGQEAQILYTRFRDLCEYWNDKILNAEDKTKITAEQISGLNDANDGLWTLFVNQYAETKTKCNAIMANDLVKDSAQKTTLNETLLNLDYIYTSELLPRMEALLAIPTPIDTTAHRTEINNVTNALTGDESYDDYLKYFLAALSAISVVADTNLLEGVKKVTKDYEDYQKTVEDAIKVKYPGMTFLGWASDTALSSMYAKAIFDSNGKIDKESISTQTAELIEDAINDYGNGQFSDVTQYANGFEHFVVSLAKAKESEYDYKAYKEVQDSLNSFLEDNVINKSEYEAIKTLRKSLESEYKDVVATYTDIYNNEHLPLATKTALQTAYNALVAAYGSSSTDPKTGAIGAIDTLIDAYETAITTQGSTKEYVEVSASTKNAVNTALATFNTKMEDYKKALENASNAINKAVAQGLVDQLKSIINSDVLPDENGNYAYAGYTATEADRLANIFGKWAVDEHGKPTTLIGYSTTQQTSDAIESAVATGVGTANSNAQGYVSALKGLINSDVLSDGTNGYASFKKQTSNAIATIVAEFNADGTIKTYSAWKQGVDSFEQEVQSARGDSASLKIRIDGISTTVTNNKTEADAAFNTLNTVTIPGLISDIGTAQSTANSSATWIDQNKDRISLISAQFDGSGNLSNTSGLVTGNGSFTTLFATALDGEMTATGKLSVYVQKDNNGKIVSGIKLSADQLDFTAANITWKLSDTWKINNKNDQTVLSFNNGNLQIAGQLTANQTNLSTTNISSTGDISSTGTISVQGNFILDNYKKIQWKDKNGTKRSMLTLDDSMDNGTLNNHFIVGEAMSSLGLTTVIRGYTINFQTGSSATKHASIDASGVFKVDKLQIGDATLEWVAGSGLKVDKTFYSTLGVAALGSGSSSGGGGGMTEEQMWTALANSSSGHSIGGSSSSKRLSNLYASNIYAGGYSVLTTNTGVTLNTEQNISGKKTFTASLMPKNAGNDLYLGNSTYRWAYIYGTTVDAYTLNFNTGKGASMSVSSNFTVGQAAVNTSYKLYVNGDSKFDGKVNIGSSVYLQNDDRGQGVHDLNINAANIRFNGNVIHASDIRLKDVKETVDFKLDIEAIARAPIFNYSWKKNPEYGLFLGSSANYWENVFRYAVSANEEGYLGMDYGATALAAAVMTARKVVEQEERIKKLEAENERLRNEIEQIKTMIGGMSNAGK